MNLFAELEADPKNIGYGILIASNNDQGVADLLNNRVFSVTASRMITARGILSDYPGGPAAAATVLDKLEAAAPSIPALKWALSFLKTTEGLDIGHAATQGMIDQLALLETITADEAGKLKGLATTLKSRSEILFGRQSTANDVAQVVRDDLGNLLIGV